MDRRDINEYESICIMGLGKMYKECIQELEQNFRISYISDNNPSYAESEMASKYRFLHPADMPRVEDLLVIVTTSFENYIALDDQLTALGIPNCYVLSIQDIRVSRPVIQLSKLTQSYKDKWGNVIEMSKNIRLPRHSFVMFGDDTNKPVHYGRGRNNRLCIGENANLYDSFLLEYYGSDCCMELGSNTHLGKIHIIIAQGAYFKIGSRSSFEGLYAVLYESGQITIGEDCMFSQNIQVWQTDTHPIFDRKTGKRINKSRNIIIGDHVWIGANATLLGGARIGSGSIVGMNGVTSSQFPPNVIIAGNPARVVREDVVWANDQLYLSDINTLSDCKDPISMLNGDGNLG